MDLSIDFYIYSTRAHVWYWEILLYYFSVNLLFFFFSLFTPSGNLLVTSRASWIDLIFLFFFLSHCLFFFSQHASSSVSSENASTFSIGMVEGWKHPSVGLRAGRNTRNTTSFPDFPTNSCFQLSPQLVYPCIWCLRFLSVSRIPRANELAFQ